MKKTKIIAVAMAVVIISSIFAACASDKTKETEGTSNSTTSVVTVTNADGKAVTDEKGKALTTVVTESSKSASTTASKSGNSTSKTSSQTTAKRASGSNSGSAVTKSNATANKNTTTKKVTTTKKKVTTTKKKVTTTKKKTTTTKKSTQSSNKPLTASQKKWVIDNWFRQFPKYGAESGFTVVEMDSANGLNSYININQGNYKSESQVGGIINDKDYMRFLANGCTKVRYYWKDTSTESVLYYKCVTN